MKNHEPSRHRSSNSRPEPRGARAGPTDLVEPLRAENESLRDSLTALERALHQYGELYEHAVVPLVALDAAGVLTRVNAAAGLLLATEPQRLLGRALRSSVLPEDRRLFADHLLRCRETRRGQTCEVRLQTAYGQPPLVELRTRWLEGNAFPYQLALIDLRDRQRYAEEHRRLVESERRAREAAAARDTFIAMLSHELRTPLTPALAIASVLKRDPALSSDLPGDFETIERCLQIEAQLIEDLLDVTSIERGKLNVRHGPVDLHQVARDAVRLLQHEAGRKQQTIVEDLTARRTYTNGDALRLRQVFVNLLRNAIDFTPEAGRIHLRSWNNGPDSIALEVADPGSGFDPASAARIFEPFEQLDDRPQSRRGLGLGLAISKGLVELHGGSIVATSAGKNRGARFVVTLAAIDEPKLARLESPPEPSSMRLVATGKVLLVEDDPETRRVIARLLDKAGFDVVAVSTKRDALAVDRDAIDLILSDVGLPDGSGLELVQELQRDRRRPAIALSGYGSQADVQRCRAAGFDLHLSKPVSIDQLLRAIRKLIIDPAANPPS